MGESMSVCGRGLSCETICPVKKIGQQCDLSVEDFALLFDAGGDIAPESSEVGVAVLVV